MIGELGRGESGSLQASGPAGGGWSEATRAAEQGVGAGVASWLMGGVGVSKGGRRVPKPRRPSRFCAGYACERSFPTTASSYWPQPVAAV